MHICINIKLFRKDKWIFITNNSMMLILSTMNYTKMILSRKLNVAVIIITMHEKDGSY